MIIVDLWRQQKADYFCISTKSSTGQWKDHYFGKNELSRVRPFIKESSDKDLYWCPHGLSKKSRKEDAAIPPKLLWADLDGADPRHMKPKPTIAFESSPGRYVGIWLIDKPMTKGLNRALTYHVGADKSGWDFGQVLRIPGTTNYKYATHPRVRCLWDDLPTHTFERVAEVVELKSKGKKKETTDLVASDVYAEHQRRFPMWVRRELLRKDLPKTGKRSEMIWKLEHALLEVGCDQDEAFVLIKASVWNKFRGRHNEDEQLRRELDKIVESRLDAEAPAGNSSTKGYKFFAHPIADAEEKNIDWLWRGRLARGELTIVEGDPGLGKSYFVQMISLHICEGWPLPDMRKGDDIKPATVLYFDIENDQGAVTKPRLADNGMGFKPGQGGKRFFQEELPITIDDEDALEGVEARIAEIRPSLIVFDTLNNYIGSADIHKSSEAQQAMIWFREIARRYNCSVVVLRHLTKGGKDKALYRGQGSIAFAGAARIVMTVGIHPDDQEQRVVAVTKMNLARLPRSLCFTISSLPDTKERRDRSKFTWGEVVDFTADDILSVTPTSQGKNKERDGAEAFLKDVLDEGPMEVRKVETMAEKRSISRRTLQRVADAIGIVKSRKGFGKNAVSLWELPDDAQRDD